MLPCSEPNPTQPNTNVDDEAVAFDFLRHRAEACAGRRLDTNAASGFGGCSCQISEDANPKRMVTLHSTVSVRSLPVLFSGIVM